MLFGISFRFFVTCPQAPYRLLNAEQPFYDRSADSWVMQSSELISSIVSPENI